MAAILSEQNLGLGICEQRAALRLSYHQGITFVQIVFDLGKIGLQKGVGGGVAGFVTGVVCKIAEIGLNVLVFNNMQIVWQTAGEQLTKSVCKQVTQKTLQEVGKEIAASGFKTGLVGFILQGGVGLYEAARHEYVLNLAIGEGAMRQYSHHLNESQNIIEEFLGDRNFIEQNAAADITDPIHAGAIIYPVKTPCDHYFNLENLIDWVRTHGDCPMCRRTPITVEELKFSWETSFKITKFIRTMIKRVEENYVPLSLRNRDIEEIKMQLTPLRDTSRDQIEIICIELSLALRKARGESSIDEDTYDQCVVKLNDWKRDL